jgi:hypothetical protein
MCAGSILISRKATQSMNAEKGIEKCWCGKTFFWQDRETRDVWVQDHTHAISDEGIAWRRG